MSGTTFSQTLRPFSRGRALTVATTTVAALKRTCQSLFLCCAFLLYLCHPALQAQNRLTGFQGGDINHVFYEGQNNNVYELYYNGRWWGNNPSAGRCLTSFGAPCPLASPKSALTGFYDGSIQHVFYVGTDDHIYELFFANGGWNSRDLMFLTGAASAFYGSALTSFFDRFSIGHIFYVDQNQHVHELYYYNGAWHDGFPDLTVTTSAPLPLPSTALTSFFDVYMVAHVFYLSSDGHVHELYNDGTWHNSNPDLTNTTGAAAALLGGGLTSYFDGFGVEHVFYIGAPNGLVLELYHDGGGWHSNYSLYSLYYPATTQSALTGFFDPNSVQHVFYQSRDGHIRESYNTGNNEWWGSDLIQDAGAPSATSGTSLASYFDTFYSVPHVFYISTSGHVVELYYSGRWWSNDLTSDTKGPPAMP
jgi:hypothetical protein